MRALDEGFASGRDAGAALHDAFPELGEADAFAVIRIPRFGADFARPVIEGVGRPVLALGVGHYEGSASPGAVGNFAVAGHRTTYGRPVPRDRHAARRRPRHRRDRTHRVRLRDHRARDR